ETPRRHLSAVPAARVYDVEHDGDIRPALRTIDDDLEHGHPQDPESAASGPGGETEALLAELAAARGVRQPLNAPDHSEPMLWDDAAHPAGAAEPGDPATAAAAGEASE